MIWNLTSDDIIAYWVASCVIGLMNFFMVAYISKERGYPPRDLSIIFVVMTLLPITNIVLFSVLLIVLCDQISHEGINDKLKKFAKNLFS